VTTLSGLAAEPDTSAIPVAIALTIYSKKAGSKYGLGPTASFNVECYNVLHLPFIPFMCCLSI